MVEAAGGKDIGYGETAFFVLGGAILGGALGEDGQTVEIGVQATDLAATRELWTTRLRRMASEPREVWGSLDVLGYEGHAKEGRSRMSLAC